MAFAAVFFALPFALASTILMAGHPSFNLSQAAVFYTLAGGGFMGAFLIALLVADLFDCSADT